MTLLARATGVIDRQVADQLVLLAAGAAEPVVLSSTAVVVWDALAEPTSRDQLVADLAASFGVAEERIAADVGPFVDELLAAGVVVSS